MLLAHSLTPGGPNAEMLMIAAFMLFLGVLFFVAKSVKPIVSLMLILGSLAVATGAFALAGQSPGASRVELSIRSPSAGSVVNAAKPVTLEVTVRGGRLSPSSSSTSGGGHLHVFVDERLVSMSSSATPRVTLESGEHNIAVEFVGPTHVSFSPKVLAQIEITAK